MGAIFIAIDGFSRSLARVVGWTMVFVMFLTVADVLLRRFANMPILWAFDISTQLFAVHFMLATAAALADGEHVSIDIFRKTLSARMQAGIELACYLIFFFPFALVLLKFGWDFAERSWASRETSIGSIQIPLYYVKTVIPVTGAILLLQGISMVARQIRILRTSEPT